MIRNFNFSLERVENILEKGENAGYQHFLHFPKCFQNSYSLKVIKSRGEEFQLLLTNGRIKVKVDNEFIY